MPAGDPEDEDFEDLDPAECESRIATYVASVERESGRVDELAERVLSVLSAAWNDLDAILDGGAHDGTLAVMLLLGQRARLRDSTDALQWQLHAAATLVSGFVAMAGPGSAGQTSTSS